jgi:NhaP-type Na+/H+ or K+/H+ antiporter
MESTLINGAVTKVKINFVISAVVAYNNNAGALDGLEQLVIQILGAMPAGYVVGIVERPAIINVGTGSFLTSDISVSTYYTQENN